VNELLQFKTKFVSLIAKQQNKTRCWFHSFTLFIGMIVLVVLTRSASSVDVECMLSITGQILNGKQSSLHMRSQDFVCGALFFGEKVDIS